MKNKIISAVLIGFCFYTTLSAQESISKEQFDELWSKADSSAKIIIKTGNTTKDLNATERNNIQSIDLKQKKVTNLNFKKMDTTNLEVFSTKPVIKGSSIKNSSTVKLKNNLDAKPKDISKPETDLIAPVKSDIKTPNDAKKEDSKIPMKTYSNEDFSSQPIVKGKRNTNETTITKPAKKIFVDTSKSYRDFSFETAPIVNNNASYDRRDEPMPKSKAQIDEEIPVNRKPNNTNTGKDNSFIKEAYAQYDKEADSLHTANKRVLDSIMKSLNIKVPIVVNSTEFIDIYVSGGGTLLNNDSKLYDHISILQSGLLQHEYKTKNDGVQRTEKKISKDELTKLAQYMVDMGFFDFKDDYDCTNEDNTCFERLKKLPQPVPFSISLTVGEKKNKVTVAMFAPKTEKNIVGYPSSLEKIMNAIYTIVEK